MYTALIFIGADLFYDKGWRDFSRLTPWEAWKLRLVAIGVVLAVSILASALVSLLPVRYIRGLLAGILTCVTLLYLAGWVGDTYLGGYARPDPFNFGRLMSEGWGLTMNIIVIPTIGVLAWIRAEFGWWNSLKA